MGGQRDDRVDESSHSGACIHESAGEGPAEIALGVEWPEPKYPDREHFRERQETLR